MTRDHERLTLLRILEALCPPCARAHPNADALTLRHLITSHPVADAYARGAFEPETIKHDRRSRSHG